VYIVFWIRAFTPEVCPSRVTAVNLFDLMLSSSNGEFLILGKTKRDLCTAFANIAGYGFTTEVFFMVERLRDLLRTTLQVPVQLGLRLLRNESTPSRKSRLM
jgi:hypothetical protein